MPGIPDNSPLWLTVAVLSFVGAMVFLQTRSGARASSADATEKIGNAYDKLLENMQERINKVEAKLRKFEVWVPLLIEQIYKLGGVPIPPPDTGDFFKPQ